MGIPDGQTIPNPGATDGYVAPRSQAERVLARIWAQVLGVDRVGVTDDFLELGGHSLPAVRLISRVRTELGAEIPMGDLFAAPTVAAMAVLIERSAAATRPALTAVPRSTVIWPLSQIALPRSATRCPRGSRGE